MVITWKTRNIRCLFPLKIKTITNRVLSIKELFSCGSRYIDETKRNAEVRWNERNNPTRSSEPSSTTILHGLSFRMLQKILRPRRTQRYHILLSGNLILTNKRTLKDQFYLEMVLHRTINDLMQTPKKEVHFFFFSVCCIVFNCS